MECYFIANILINDESEYLQYLSQATDIFKKYNGSYISVDKNPVTIEGSWNYSRIVLIKFPSEEGFYEWYNSYEYQSILKHRLKAAKCDSIIIKGNC